MTERSTSINMRQCLVVLMVLALIEAGPLSLHHCFAMGVSHHEFVEEFEEHKIKIMKSAGRIIGVAAAEPVQLAIWNRYLNSLSAYRISPPTYLQNCTLLM